MKALLLKIWDRTRSSFWFVPAAMALLAVALAYGAVALDKADAQGWLQRLGLHYSGDAEGASLMLNTVAGSMISIAGTVFSITLVALSLASSQLGPRLLRNFMRDTSNQVVLGTFVATFVYCLLVLRTIRRDDEASFVPHLAVSLGVLLAVLSIGVLIYFIHHVSVSIRADVVVARVAEELDDGIERLYPSHLGQPPPAGTAAAATHGLPAAFQDEARPVGAREDGYLQLVDAEALMSLASRQDLLLRLERRPGHYLVQGQPMVMVWPGERLDEALGKEINDAFVLRAERTATQDVEFPFQQLVEIAVRALSPGVNDPFTAIVCVDRLSSALCRLARREMPSPVRFDDQGRLRLVAPGATWAGIVDTALNQIRQSARSHPAVMMRLLEAIAQVACQVQHEQDAAHLQRHADMVIRGAREATPEAEDLRDLEARYLTATQMIRGHRG